MWPAPYSPGSRTSTTSASSRLMRCVASLVLTQGPPAVRRKSGHSSIAPETNATTKRRRLLRTKSTEPVIIMKRDGQARPPAPRRVGLEPRESLHRLDRRRPLPAGHRRGARRRQAPQVRRLRVRPRLHLGPAPRDPHALDRSRRARPAVASGGEELAAERAPLRRAAGPE